MCCAVTSSRCGSSPSTSSAWRLSPADLHPQPTARQRGEALERVAVEVDDVPVPAGAPVDQGDDDAAPAAAHLHASAPPVADAKRAARGCVQATGVIVVADAHAGHAVPGRRPGRMVSGEPDALRLRDRLRDRWLRGRRTPDGARSVDTREVEDPLAGVDRADLVSD